DDPFTARALEQMREVFGPGSRSYFVFTGTAANVLSVEASCRSHHAVVCARSAHLNVDECGAPERYTGCKILTLPSPDGKLRPAQAEPLLEVLGVPHHAQPRLISITQPTELGTVYTPDEIKELAGFAHSRGLYLHMDGARLSNAAAALDTGLLEVSGGAGVDVLSFGGTKNGLMFGEAVVVFRPALDEAFTYQRKQAMQLGSKMRFLAVQFSAFLENELWRANAAHANRMARVLAEGVRAAPGCSLTQEVQSNGVFVRMPRGTADRLLERYFFYTWSTADPGAPVVRLMTSFDTTEGDVARFLDALRRAAEGGP
ncbi:MAG: threonine aldolase family protein, partial [Spirochaetota bacterium]